MVTQWGFSEKLGPLLYAEEEGEVFLGRSVTQTKHMSDDTAKLIDNEIRILIDRNYDRAQQILKDNMDIMHAMKDALMKYETIDAGQIDDLMERKEEIREPQGWTTDSAEQVKRSREEAKSAMGGDKKEGQPAESKESTEAKSEQQSDVEKDNKSE
jgi:cell division protease FtsH